MELKRYIVLLLTLVASDLLYSKETPQRLCGVRKSACQDVRYPCQCYCSRKCGPRVKEADDVPVYVPNDPAGHYCYCKQWDLDNFEERCGGTR